MQETEAWNFSSEGFVRLEDYRSRIIVEIMRLVSTEKVEVLNPDTKISSKFWNIRTERNLIQREKNQTLKMKKRVKNFCWRI